MDVEEGERIIREYAESLSGDAKAAFTNMRRERQGKRRHVTLIENVILTLLADPNADKHAVQTALKKFLQRIEDLEECQLRYESIITSDSTAEAATFLHQAKYGTRNLLTQSKAEKFLDSADDNTDTTDILLPTGQLPTFDGSSASDYVSFINIFKSLVDTKKIPKSMKLTYLKSCLIDSAKQLAKGYTELTDANYDNLLSQLQSKYGNERLIAHEHYTAILDMPDFKWPELPAWHNKLHSHVRSLESMGLDLEANAGFLTTIVQRKMP